jgi:hypothetical protein
VSVDSEVRQAGAFVNDVLDGQERVGAREREDNIRPDKDDYSG